MAKGYVDYITQRHFNWLHAKKNAERIIFDHQDLSGIDFKGRDLTSAIFYGCNLKGADFSNCNCYQIDFTNSDLDGAIFYHANLEGAKFNKANLASCDFYMANMKDVTGNNKEIKTFQLGKYIVNLIGDIININGTGYSYDEWNHSPDEKLNKIAFCFSKWLDDNLMLLKAISSSQEKK